MASELTLDWSSLVKIIPLCLEFRERALRHEDIDLRDAASRVGTVFGVDDIDQFAVQKIRAAMENGLADAFRSSDAKELAGLFAANARPVMELIARYAQGKLTAEKLIAGLNELCFSNVEKMQLILEEAIGVPDAVAEFLTGKLGPYLVSLYAFAAAYKIYERADQDAALAYERRLEIEQLANEAIAELKRQRSEMEDLVESCLLDQLEPFSEGIAAMDQAVLDCNDDEYIAANAELWRLFRRGTQYETAAEFDGLMLSEDAFRL